MLGAWGHAQPSKSAMGSHPNSWSGHGFGMWTARGTLDPQRVCKVQVLALSIRKRMLGCPCSRWVPSGYPFPYARGEWAVCKDLLRMGSDVFWRQEPARKRSGLTPRQGAKFLCKYGIERFETSNLRECIHVQVLLDLYLETLDMDRLHLIQDLLAVTRGVLGDNDH